MIEATPYARALGISRIIDCEGRPFLSLLATSSLEGRPGFLYGGVIAGLLELACLDILLAEIEGVTQPLEPISFSVDFLRGGLLQPTFAQARIVRIGKNVANASAACWQTDREKPITVARMHVALCR